jgi:hypothetical protein
VLETDVQESGLKIKVVEKVGTNIKRMVQRSNPPLKRIVWRIVLRINGRGPRVTYEIKCEECNMNCAGKTASSAYTRGKEHFKGLQDESENTFLKRHSIKRPY